MLARERRMLTSLVNCWRKPPAQAPVEPRPTPLAPWLQGALELGSFCQTSL